MSVLDAINYYDGIEEGELTPSPSEEEDGVVSKLPLHAAEDRGHLEYKHLQDRGHKKRRRFRRQRVETSDEKTRIEGEQRLRSLVMQSFKDRIQDTK